MTLNYGNYGKFLWLFVYFHLHLLVFEQICGSRKRRDVSEETGSSGTSGSAVLTAGPIITRSGTVSLHSHHLLQLILCTQTLPVLQK